MRYIEVVKKVKKEQHGNRDKPKAGCILSFGVISESGISRFDYNMNWLHEHFCGHIVSNRDKSLENFMKGVPVICSS